ncbi:cilia- and flagella-associated protein 298 [Trichechus manatus latirostris]|uniref:Cilia- and flagella-associated protein 298 n=1 Tax=Trichechus manatus latirostris TaxID=127582 RepID=A0A2Y9RR91_TRIMA|nr:cilia- and flagella-associated protein 298 [Trichechus manatus latirostris]
MVLLHVKRGDESQFLLQAPGSSELEELTVQVTRIYNGRLKVQRLCSEMEELAEHGVFLPPNMQGLTDDQIEELKLKDEWGEKCVPSGGSVFKKDDVGRRNGQGPPESRLLGSIPQPPVPPVQVDAGAPPEHLGTHCPLSVLPRFCFIPEARPKLGYVALVARTVCSLLLLKQCLARAPSEKLKQVGANVCVTMEMVKDALDQLRGAVMIVYPMGLPPHDPIRMELENKEDLAGTQISTRATTTCEIEVVPLAQLLRKG